MATRGPATRARADRAHGIEPTHDVGRIEHRLALRLVQVTLEDDEDDAVDGILGTAVDVAKNRRGAEQRRQILHLAGLAGVHGGTRDERFIHPAAQLEDRERAVLGYCTVPYRDEYDGIDMKRGYEEMAPRPSPAVP